MSQTNTDMLKEIRGQISDIKVNTQTTKRHIIDLICNKIMLIKNKWNGTLFNSEQPHNS